MGIGWGDLGLTEAEHNVEEDNQNDSRAVNIEPIFPHPERAGRDMAPSSEQVRANGKRIRRSREDDERTSEIGERCMAAKGDCTETGADDRAQKCSWNGA